MSSINRNLTEGSNVISCIASRWTKNTTTTRLTTEEAQAIVLEHAGFAAEDVQWLRTEFEMDDLVPQYEVQFRQGGLEYEYEVHGETGEILSMDVDD